MRELGCTFCSFCCWATSIDTATAFCLISIGWFGSCLGLSYFQTKLQQLPILFGLSRPIHIQEIDSRTFSIFSNEVLPNLRLEKVTRPTVLNVRMKSSAHSPWRIILNPVVASYLVSTRPNKAFSLTLTRKICQVSVPTGIIPPKTLSKRQFLLRPVSCNLKSGSIASNRFWELRPYSFTKLCISYTPRRSTTFWIQYVVTSWTNFQLS